MNANLKNTVTNICAILIVIAGAIAGAIQTGTITFLPAWVTSACLLVGVIATAIIGWLTGKNPNLSNKSDSQVSKANTGQ